MTLNFAKMAVRVARQNVNIGYHFEFLGNYDLRSGVLYFRVLENITNGFIAKSSARQFSLIHQYLLLPSSHNSVGGIFERGTMALERTKGAPKRLS